MTEREKREKVKDVINAFERVVEVFNGRISGPYFEAWMCATKDALALLKAQEPRVMTLDEAKSAFVIEYRSGNMRDVGAGLLDLDVDPANAYYGVIYRVWTSRPTDEQREGAKWND